MSDGFRGDERIGNYAAEQIVLGAYAKLVCRFYADERLGGHEVHMTFVVRGRVVFARVVVSLECSELGGNPGTACGFMAPRTVRRRIRVEHDRAIGGMFGTVH